MWLRVRIKFPFSLVCIFQHPLPEQRIISFKALDIQDQSLQPLQIVPPPFLKESSAKTILEFVRQHSIPNNVRILHALAHIEYNAFMSYVDTLLRYRQETANYKILFQQDMRALALDEATHFLQLQSRLSQLGYSYGSIPVIPKLALAIDSTSQSLIDRIAVISLVHEGRGVKAVEKLLSQLGKAHDYESVKIVQGIQTDEKKHFEQGWKWFKIGCLLKNMEMKEAIESVNQRYRADIRLPDEQ